MKACKEEMLLQTSTASAEPMRCWGARPQTRRQRRLPGNIPSSKAQGSPSQAGASPAPGSWPCLPVEKDPTGETSGQAAGGHLQCPCKATGREKETGTTELSLALRPPPQPSSSQGPHCLFSEMTQPVKALAFILSVIPRAHTVDGENQFPDP